MEENKKALEFLLSKNEQLTKRYIEVEEFIIKLNWYERLFCSKKIINFIKSRSEKYNF